MIRVENLCKNFGKNQILKNVNLEIKKGEVVSIIGRSGCGKSTFLRCMNGLEKATSGNIFINDLDILDNKNNIDKIRAKVGMVYQDFNLFSNLNVIENLILAPIKVNGMKREDALVEAESLLKVVGMENRKYHMPHQLSGGQKQRVAIARCLMMKPDVILFDEPTSSLDPSMVDEVEEVIIKCVEKGITCVIVTHEMNFAKKVSTRVIYMDDYCIYEEGTPDEIFNNPKKLLTKHFIEKSKKFAFTINHENLDIYEFMAKVKKYSEKYEVKSEVINALNVIYEEIVYSVISGRKTSCCDFTLSLDKGEKKVEMLFTNIRSNPFEDGTLDTIQINMINHVINHYEVFEDRTNKEVTIKIEL